MKKLFFVIMATGILICTGFKNLPKEDSGNWVSLFNGKNLDGWKFNDEPGTFSVVDGMIKVNGNRSHLFYDGPVGNHDFTNFELKADIMTLPGSNSGIYFHTEYQPEGWPDKGYEVQVNNSHTDWKRTGGLYDVSDLREVPTKDNEWFTMHIIVIGKHIEIKLNGNTVVDFTEPKNPDYKGHPGRKISNGTFCLQGHDPKSTVFFKNIMVKPLP